MIMIEVSNGKFSNIQVAGHPIFSTSRRTASSVGTGNKHNIGRPSPFGVGVEARLTVATGCNGDAIFMAIADYHPAGLEMVRHQSLWILTIRHPGDESK